MKTETIANRNLKEYIERNNSVPTREDVINILSMLPLFISNSFEIPMMEEKNNTSNMEETKNVKKRTKRESTKSSNEILEDVKNLQKKLNKMPTMNDIKENNIDITPLLRTCGGWRNLKKSLTDRSEEDAILTLMDSIERIPTREDLNENNVDISNLLLQHGSWRNIKRELNLDAKYEEIIKNKLEQLKQTEKLSIENCKKNNIDIAFLIRKYGGWKEVVKNLNLK